MEMVNQSIKGVMLAVMLSLLNGCAIPGSHISDNNALFVTEQVEQSFEVTAELNQIEITPALVHAMKPSSEGTQLNPILDRQLGEYDYRVGVGDVLNITVWDHPELTIPAGSYRSAEDTGNWVHNDGTIFYPYVGKVKVDGLLVTEIRDILTQKLSKYIESPQVDVSVAAFRSQRVFVTGEVNNAGQQPITNLPLTLLDAINGAGGLTGEADWHSVVLSRGGHEYLFSLQALYEQGDLMQNTLLRHNDVIHVSRNDSQKVFVLGEVIKPQSVLMERQGMSLAEALTEAGGINEQRADASGVFVIRANPDDQQTVADVYQMDVADARALVLAEQFPLHARDIVYVTAAPISRWNRILLQLMPTILAVDGVVGVADDVQDL